MRKEIRTSALQETYQGHKPYPYPWLPWQENTTEQSLNTNLILKHSNEGGEGKNWKGKDKKDDCKSFENNPKP